MNVYEEAHNLCRAIKESEEYKQYIAANEKIKENEDVKKMLDDFTKKQMELQAKQAMGEKIDDQIKESVQQLSGIVMSDPAAAEFIQSQARFGIMMQDVFKLIDEAVSLK